MPRRFIDSIGGSASILQAEKVRKLKQQGRHIIDLSIGQPDFKTHSDIINASIKALHNNRTAYTSSAGLPELRQAVAKNLNQRYFLDIHPDQILVTPGLKQGIWYALESLINDGDEVLLIEPCWLSYADMVTLCGGHPISISTNGGADFLPAIKDIEAHISNKSRVIIINSPNNPSGFIYTGDFLKSLTELCLSKNIYIISDDIYKDFVYDHTHVDHVASYDRTLENIVIADGFSKSYSMTGYRLGYITGAPDIIETCHKLQQQTATCPPSISQYAALAALELPQSYLNENASFYEARRNALLDHAESLGIQIVKPSGAIYCLLRLPEEKNNSVSAAERLLYDYSVATVPGIAYGKSVSSYLRLTLSASIAELKEALDRISRFIKV